MTASKIFLYFCLAFVAGIFLNSLVEISQLVMLGALILGLILISVLWHRKKIAVFGFCILFLALGVFRHQQVENRSTKSEIRNHNDTGENIILVGIVAEEPDVRASSVKLEIKSEEGKILGTTSRYPEYKYGQVLEITGKLKTPSEDIEGFNYKEYLSKEGIYSEMSWPKIRPTGENKGNIIYKYLFAAKGKLKESVNRVMSPPQSGLLEALFFGDEENVSQEWKDKFNITGTRHITAVSGMNITIIASLILNFLLLLGLYRSQAFYISVILIILFIMMIGAPASALRAGVMGILLLTAQHFGRLSSASRAVVFASTFMLALNPLLLKIDVGFQLSFLAVMGLIYLQPWFLSLFRKIPNVFQLRYTLAATLSAQVFTLPILIYNFGRISPLSPLSNILIVPTLSLVTIFGFVFSILGIIFLPLGQLISWFAWLILSYIIAIIDFFSKIPFASVTINGVHWMWMVAFYLILGFFVWRLREREKLKFLEY